MATIVPILTGMRTDNPGNGLCVFFWDPKYEFWPAGIGSSLGYANYVGPLAYNANTLDATTAERPGTKRKSEVNGILGGYLGVGFDIKGNFSNTEDGKTGSVIEKIDTSSGVVTGAAITSLQPNTVSVRMGEISAYSVHSCSPNLLNYPITRELSAANTFDEKLVSSPPVGLHQQISNRDQITYKSVKVSLLNNGSTLKVDIKNPDDGKYYTYHYVDLGNKGLGGGGSYTKDPNPETLRVGIALATSDSIMNCELKNVTLQGNFTQYDKTEIIPSSTPRLSAFYR